MRLAHLIVTLACLTLACLAPVSPAAAQNPYSPALTVNESVITHYDIEQRMALQSALGATGDLRELAIEQLIDDRLRVQAAEALEIELPEGALEAGLEEFATARGLGIDEVLRVLEARGIDRQTMDDFVEAGLVWREVVLRRFRDRALPDEADLDAALDIEATTPREVLDLAEIALPFEERGEAATMELAERLSRELARGGDFTQAVRTYSRSGTVAQGGRLAPVPAAQLPDPIRAQVLLLEPGGVTEPVPIAGGVAILKLLAIRQEAPGAPPEGPEGESPREALRQQLFSQRITNFGEGYLQELRGDALISRR